MIKSAVQYKLSQIFDIDTKVQYKIPRFQREYTWGKEEWDYLFDDLFENDPGYFLGTIICVNEAKDALGITPLEVIDGQQRLATISIFYAAIYNKLSKEYRTDDDFISEKSNLKNRLIIKGAASNALKLELSLQNRNFDDYKAILNELGLYTEINFSKPPNLGNRRLYKSYQHFKKELIDLDYHGLLQIMDKVNSANIVKIEVDSHADAYTLFESLNNRGVPLSSMDLVKNKVLSKLEKTEAKPIQQAYDEWVGLIDNLPHFYQERFLRQYYNAFRYDKKISLKGFSRATKSTLIKIYDKLIDRDPGFIFDELIQKSEIYNSFIDPNKNGNADSTYQGLLDLLHVGAAPGYTLLLYLCSKYQNGCEIIRNTIDFLVKYFVRRNLTGFPETRYLDNIFIRLIDKCEENTDQVTPNLIIDYLCDPSRFSDIVALKNILTGDIYDENADLARFILCKLEEAHFTKETHKDLWERDSNGKYLWTMEHIFPEGRNIPQAWIDMIAGGNEKQAKELQDGWVHKLGNLTLTVYNSSLSNFSFERKRDREDSNGNPIGYKNGLYLNIDLRDKSSWHIEDIENRTEKLVKQALHLLALPHEEN